MRSPWFILVLVIASFFSQMLRAEKRRLPTKRPQPSIVLDLELRRLRTAAHMPSAVFRERCGRAVEYAEKHGLASPEILEEIEEIEDVFVAAERKRGSDSSPESIPSVATRP